MKTRLNLTSNLLDQNNPKSNYQCEKELLYIRDFEATQKTRSRVLPGSKTLSDKLLLTSSTVLIIYQLHLPGK